MPRHVPDYEDANLVLRLYEDRREPKLREAREWFMDQFHPTNLADLLKKYPLGSDGNRMFRMVVSYWEMVGAIINNGVLDEGLYFQTTGEHLLVWEKIRHLIPEFREMRKSPILYRNLEELARRHYAWLEEQSTGLAEITMGHFRSLMKMNG